jgi:transcriptional regulator with XRE-family HTH domain
MKLREWRLSKGLTGESAAAMAGFHPSIWSKWERGLSVPRRANAERIAELTENAVTPNDFYNLPVVNHGSDLSNNPNFDETDEIAPATRPAAA